MRSAGLFDLQVNGFAGIDFNAETIDADQLDHALEAMLATGVTACLPTLITAPADVLASALRRARSRRGAKPPRRRSWCPATISKAPSSIRPRATPDAIRPTP